MTQLKKRIQTAQVKASLAINKELILLYWEIGKEIANRQKLNKWGSSVIDHLAKDLRISFPDLKGFSRSNIFRMRAFYLSCQIVAQPARQFAVHDLPEAFLLIPWWHNVILMEKIPSLEERTWYAKKTVEESWSRNVLTMQIESNLFSRQGNAITNFHLTLPSPQSDLAQETMKDPYSFGFLNIFEKVKEKEIEKGLVDHIQNLLLELGNGFAFVGRQYPLTIEGTDYFLDLLFYNYKLKCFCIVELKTGEFQPEFAGKMNFYLSAVDDLIKQPSDQPTIGMILCKNKKKITVEYSLRNCKTPIGVSNYTTKVLDGLPAKLKESLPSDGEIEEHLSTIDFFD